MPKQQHPLTFVDPSFFIKLKQYKLNDLKLDTSETELNAAIEFISSKKPPALQLTQESFQLTNPQLNGSILNLNTLNEFKNIDKIELLNLRLQKLQENINSSNPSLKCLSQFFVLSFADLKKYKFYYWFMFPAIECSFSLIDLELDILNSNLNDIITELDNSSLELGKFAVKNFQNDDIYYLNNLAAFVYYKKYKKCHIYLHGGTSPRWVELKINSVDFGKGSGWERNSSNKLVPKLVDLSSLLDPNQLATEAVDLNLRLMKWRASPQIDLERIQSCKCLLLGAGTLGSYIARGLMAWGVKTITFVDSGHVSYSNPVRQPLYLHEDCVENAPKALAAANFLKRVFPKVNSTGYKLHIPMVGHPLNTFEEYVQLVDLIKEHDAVFLLLDSRESRWLPTVVCNALNKLVINVALGFDSFLVMRHGINRHLGCYFCSDVVAPQNSTSNLSLDMMCTVTRPGGAMVASGHAVELLARIYQHPDLGKAEINAETCLGEIPHQLRGFLSDYTTYKVGGDSFPSCSACGNAVDMWKKDGYEFVKRAVLDTSYLGMVSGLDKLVEGVDLASDSEGEVF